MAGDWIKMRVDLQSHPKIVRILSALKSDKFRVIGGLHAVWAVVDTHSVDGVLNGYTPDAMDHVIGWPGFCAAMIDVGWMHWDGNQTLVLPEFSAHNGKSAKRRAEDQKRKRDSRSSDSCPQSVRNLSGDDAENCPQESGLEKSREEKKKSKSKSSLASAHFERFWSEYPLKKSKVSAEKAWRLGECDFVADRIIEAVKASKANDKQWRDPQFIPHASTYLNQRRWEDEAPVKSLLDMTEWELRMRAAI